jgi:hypothetical protein
MKFEDIKNACLEYKEIEESNLSLKDIYLLAENLFNEFGNGSNSHFKKDIEDIVKSLGGIINYASLDDMINYIDSYCLINKKEDFNIILPRWTGPVTDRPLMIHGLASYIFNINEEKKKAKKEISIYNYESWLFTAGFFMPEILYEEQKNKLNGNVKEMAHYFYTTEDLVNFRMKHELTLFD